MPLQGHRWEQHIHVLPFKCSVKFKWSLMPMIKWSLKFMLKWSFTLKLKLSLILKFKRSLKSTWSLLLISPNLPQPAFQGHHSTFAPTHFCVSLFHQQIALTVPEGTIVCSTKWLTEQKCLIRNAALVQAISLKHGKHGMGWEWDGAVFFDLWLHWEICGVDCSVVAIVLDGSDIWWLAFELMGLTLVVVLVLVV